MTSSSYSILTRAIIFLSLLKAVETAGQMPENVKFKNSSAGSAPKGYSHWSEIDLSNCTMIIISGQIAMDVKGNVVGRNDLARQTEQVFVNLRSIMADAGGNMDNIVKLGYFMTDASQIQIVREIRNKFINKQHPPASTLVQISRLAAADLLIEIEATAIIPKNQLK